MEPICYVDDDPLPPKDELLAQLGGGCDRATLLTTLRLMCPCRNTCRDLDAWRALQALQPHTDPEIREAAHHTILTLRERARVDTRAAEILLAIGEVGSPKRMRWLRERAGGIASARPKAVRLDVPTLIEMLASPDEHDQSDALTALFRRDRHVASPVWRDIADACRSADRRKRAKAVVALRRIEQHRAARTIAV